MMFCKLFIVNCSEIVICIVCVVVMIGLFLVVVYFEDDCDVLYLLCIDEVVFLFGIGLCVYFDGVVIFVVVCVVGVDVVYFGYGFLSESVVFVCECVQVGVQFIGLLLCVFEFFGDKVCVWVFVYEVGIFIVSGI